MHRQEQAVITEVPAARTLRWVMSSILAISIGAGGMAAGTVPVAAQGLAGGLAPLGEHAVAPTQVQAPPPPGWRPPPRRGWHRPPPPPPHGRWGNPYWRNNGWYYRDNTGAWIAAGIVGAAIGAAAVSAAQQQRAQQDAVAYCMQRYRSYNPRTGTYTGYDGLQHPCP
ncbi:BA14K family protein [Xanthobacter agilis]|uniref:Lectin-like protein BA14k n=1 Tax=Xanthobacter agilis TaxID=47492 RepID=A0ABU0LF20_XANAG|nr:BA14K family protein [Xanthobacter agilis]MDQ0505665.1 hypothetical protein [Xanthobacter agilis]